MTFLKKGSHAATRYSYPTPEHKKKAVKILESSHSNFRNTINDEKAVKAVSI